MREENLNHECQVICTPRGANHIFFFRNKPVMLFIECAGKST